MSRKEKRFSERERTVDPDLNRWERQRDYHLMVRVPFENVHNVWVDMTTRELVIEYEEDN